MESVYITKAAVFFPNEPVSNENMEQYLGMIGGKPSPARRIVLGKNGIKNRYYALDREGNVTHTNVQIAANAIRNLFDEKISLNDIDMIACGTSSPEQLLPSHGVMVRGELGGRRNMEAASFAGSCCTGIQAMRYGYMSILTGSARNAVCCGSERMSAWMTARYFEKETELFSQIEKRPMLAFEKEFLRWMLSDGGAALLLQNKPADGGLSLHVDWIEITSYAHEMETCMYAGGEKREDGSFAGWTMFPEMEWLTKSLFSIKQDTRILGENIVSLGGRYLLELARKRNFKAADIDWFLPHLSSMFFREQILKEFGKIGFYIPEEKWFLNLSKIGNIGSASPFAMVEELLYSGKLKKGEKLLLMIPESARFSYSYCMLTVC
ncbi:MAG: beta-ketoacyl-ACP synthase III [Tannerella sp.]|jgi:3-oxoacyl-[acyl-carrier-protein] synthase-3|nr:beta-ketoacyl-ACP synthase III [Tannerella sp.]